MAGLAMTRQEIIDLIGWHYQTMTEEEKNILSRVEHIVEISVLREREACAKVCEERMTYWHRGDPNIYEDEMCAAAIRARSNP